MACFTVPLAGAVVALGAEKSLSKKTKNPFLKHLDWLVKMSFGGSFILAIEHIYHGEIIFTPPFLTAMKNPEDTQEMLHEMATVGTGMTIALLATWIGMIAVSSLMERRSLSFYFSKATLWRTLLLGAIGTAVMFAVDIAMA